MDMSFKPPKELVQPSSKSWMERIFKAKAVMKGGVVRRSKRDVELFGGREALLEIVEARNFHLVECGDQYIVICNPGLLRVHT